MIRSPKNEDCIIHGWWWSHRTRLMMIVIMMMTAPKKNSGPLWKNCKIVIFTVWVMTGGAKSALRPSRPQTFCPLNEKRWFFKFSPLHKSPTSTCLPAGSKATIFCPRFENRFYRNYNFSLFCRCLPSSSPSGWSPYFRCLFLLSTGSQIANKNTVWHLLWCFSLSNGKCHIVVIWSNSCGPMKTEKVVVDIYWRTMT